MQEYIPKFIATPYGIMANGMPLNKLILRSMPSQAMRYIKRAEELLATVKMEDWDSHTPHAMHNIPALAKAQMMLVLVSPRPFLSPLDKRGYNANQPRVPKGNGRPSGRWVSTDGVTAADLKNPRFKGMDHTQIKKQKFIDTYLSAAEKGAQQLNVPVQNILGLSAVESGWGRDKFPLVGNNFFGQHYPTSFATGSFPVADDPTVRGAKFDSYSDSLQSFIANRGDTVQGISDPTQFMQALQDSGAYGIIKGGTIKHPVYYPDPKYVPKVVETINNLSDNIAPARQQKK